MIFYALNHGVEEVEILVGVKGQENNGSDAGDIDMGGYLEGCKVLMDWFMKGRRKGERR